MPLGYTNPGKKTGKSDEGSGKTKISTTEGQSNGRQRKPLKHRGTEETEEQKKEEIFGL
jgi:hypothetical protein